MPKYEVVKSAGVSFPVGRQFEVDVLDPALVQHCKEVGGGKARAKVEDDGPEVDYTLLAGLDESTYAEAVKLDKLHDKAVKDAAKPAKTAAAKPATDGPGENS